MKTRSEPLEIPDRLPYFRVDCGARGAFTFRRLPPSRYVSEFLPIAQLIDANRLTLVAQMERVERMGDESLTDDERMALVEEIEQANAGYCEAVAVLEWCWSWVVGSMWADPVVELEARTTLDTPALRREAWPPDAGELDECFGRAVFEELYDAGWTSPQIATLGARLTEAQQGGHGIAEAMPDDVSARVRFFGQAPEPTPS